ncbi:hypothetical protein U1Q18_009186, partial [Sarracenia purpurea var. burkii]
LWLDPVELSWGFYAAVIGSPLAARAFWLETWSFSFFSQPNASPNFLCAVLLAFDFTGGASCRVNLLFYAVKKWNENYRRVLFQWNEINHSGSKEVAAYFGFCSQGVLIQFWLQILGSGCGSVSAAIILGPQGALSFVLGPLSLQICCPDPVGVM